MVVPGDHLWGIAERTLAARLGRSPTLPVLAAYWRRLVEANEGLLRSGDPDLIYPGETVLLPPVEREVGP